MSNSKYFMELLYVFINYSKVASIQADFWYVCSLIEYFINSVSFFIQQIWVFACIKHHKVLPSHFPLAVQLGSLNLILFSSLM